MSNSAVAIVDAFCDSSKVKVTISGDLQTAEIGGYKCLGVIEWNDALKVYDFKKVAVLGKVRD